MADLPMYVTMHRFRLIIAQPRGEAIAFVPGGAEPVD
jgi:hypothetical protein